MAAAVKSAVLGENSDLCRLDVSFRVSLNVLN